jgi:putative intracellular protease/amidase
LTEIALFLYDDMTALDAVGPYEVLSRLPDAEVRFVASTPGPKKTDSGLVLVADSALEDLPEPDIIVIPGSGKLPFLNDPAAVEWVRGAHQTSRWTTSVCTGSTLLGAAGVLEGSVRRRTGPSASHFVTSAPSQSPSASSSGARSSPRPVSRPGSTWL